MDNDDDAIFITIRIKRPTPEKTVGYIGAACSHPFLPGESWRRGRDLADGPCTEETLLRIVEDVRAVMEGFPSAFARDGSV